MGELLTKYLVEMHVLSLEERLEKEKLGLWTIYELVNGTMPIVDEINDNKRLLDEIKTGYYNGVKIKKQLGSAHYYFRALQIWEHFEGQE